MASLMTTDPTDATPQRLNPQEGPPETPPDLTDLDDPRDHLTTHELALVEAWSKQYNKGRSSK